MRDSLLIDAQRLHDVLISLGYKNVKPNVYRKSKFHVIIHPKKNYVDLHIHVDKMSWNPSWHHSRKVGKDINQEFQNIKRALKGVGSRQVTEQPEPRLQTS